MADRPITPAPPVAPPPTSDKRTEFRQYLQRTGTWDSLTRVLVNLYEETEKPSNPLEYFADHLGSGQALADELDSLQKELAEIDSKIAEVDTDNERLRKLVEEKTAEAEAQVAAQQQVQPVQQPPPGTKEKGKGKEKPGVKGKK